jgi:hypothetical protein
MPSFTSADKAIFLLHKYAVNDAAARLNILFNQTNHAY